MRLLNIEAGPWGGLMLAVLIVLTIAAFYLTSFFMSGVALVVIVVVPIVAFVYFVGRRVGARLVHGGR